MASATYTARAIVLRKTKLGESDLIVTLLAQDGSQARAVAKGARKPSSPFAARLELYSSVDLLCSKGRSLDLVKEACLVEGNKALRSSLERSAAAAVLAELLDRATQASLENPRLFDLTHAAYARIAEADMANVPALTAACLLKACAFLGLRPHLDTCVVCENLVGGRVDDMVALSYAEGGVVCEACRAHVETAYLPEAVVAWARMLLASTFAQIEETRMGAREAFAVLGFLRLWIREHVGVNLKSMEFFLTCVGPLLEE